MTRIVGIVSLFGCCTAINVGFISVPAHAAVNCKCITVVNFYTVAMLF